MFFSFSQVKAYNTHYQAIMKVAHLFDRYLNNTMSWAYRLIRYTPDLEKTIVSPLVLRNRFFDADFEYIEDPVQNGLGLPVVKSEWEISEPRKLWCGFALRTYFPFYVKNVILKCGIDVMHAHFAHVGVAFMHVAEKLKVPLIVSFYGTDYERLPFEKPRYKKWYRKMFEVATFVVCEGKNGAILLEKLGCPAEKIRTVRLGIDAQSIPDITKGKRANSLSLVQAATFTETKGFLFTLQAFLLALEDCPDMTLTLVGEKWDQKYWVEMQELISKSPYQDRITVLDFIEDDFHGFLSRFDVFIHPSCYSALRECEGGAPIVLLDAQAVGLPVISTHHCDIPEEVVDGVTGLLSEEKNVSALRDSIVRFYHMEEKEYLDFSQSARKHVFQNYDSSKNSLSMKAVYEEALLSAHKFATN